MIELVPLADIFDLRWTVLRAGLPREAARYPEDAYPDTFHLAARGDDGTAICCGTFFPEPLDGVPAWRLRGMATVPALRGQGLGGALLAAGIAEIADRGGQLVWCNGRAGAAAFYQRHGFAVRGDLFDVPPIGPHYVFVREVAQAPHEP